jgi:hypothetical protein
MYDQWRLPVYPGSSTDLFIFFSVWIFQPQQPAELPGMFCSSEVEISKTALYLQQTNAGRGC